MAELSAVETAPVATPARPYAPSWFDRFTDWIDDLPFPAPAFYIGMAVLLAGIQIILQWNAWGGVIYGFPLVYVVTLPYHLALTHYLDHVAARSLNRLRPLLSVSPAEADEFLYRLTTLPNRGVMIAGFFGILYGFFILVSIPYDIQITDLHFTDAPVSRAFNIVFTPILFFFVAIMVYHAIHQLNVVRQIYDGCIKIDLFSLRPLYAFSSLSGLTVIGIGFNTYLWFSSSPALFEFNLVFLFIFVVVALLTFILPLRGAHSLLVEEKERLLSENGERHRAMTTELHRRVDANELGEIDNLSKTLSSLDLERVLLERVSTWPWQPGTIRTVIAALLFPVVVWLMQWLLERVLASG